jgi:hypothetical protein
VFEGLGIRWLGFGWLFLLSPEMRLVKEGIKGRKSLALERDAM